MRNGDGREGRARGSGNRFGDPASGDRRRSGEGAGPGYGGARRSAAGGGPAHSFRGDGRRDERRSGARGSEGRKGDERGGYRRGDAQDRGGRGGYRPDGRGGQNGPQREGGPRTGAARGPVGRGGQSENGARTKPGEPTIPSDVDAKELDSAVRRDLISLDKGNAELVAGHLVMAGRLLDSEPAKALEHARAARERAGRIAAVREACGIAAYTNGEWAEALSELRAAKRMGGTLAVLPLLADCERGLGRPEKAVELARGEEAAGLEGDERSELRIVEAGARMDMGEFDKAIVTLQQEDLDPQRRGFHAARLFYAYAEALLAGGRRDDATTWFLNAAAADEDEFTDAEHRVAELGGASDL
ncbi:hypothetical protein [Tsukamurella sp. 8J]|uniref:hypothetical protein n=1 Tax=Tsukamurella sp. 8J TaxID=3031962 RepID=UPI0023B8CBB3|nr:hypothetical protein [Tsukamurella sp. 8J]MDF0532639.1 hypothetical protein [Tsukamurella sp. 8J]